jgi:hypothetical protein
LGATIEGYDGAKADVSDGRLHVVNETPFEKAVREGNAYAWSWSYAMGAADTALAVKNLATNQTLVIERVVVSNDAAGEWQFHTCDLCTTGTTIYGTNLNKTSGNEAVALAKEDETGNTLANGSLLIEFALAADQTVVFDNLGVRLGFEQSVGLDSAAAAGAASYGAIIGYYE